MTPFGRKRPPIRQGGQSARSAHQDVTAGECRLSEPLRVGFRACCVICFLALRRRVSRFAERNIQQDPGRTKVYYPWGANHAGLVLENDSQETIARRIEWTLLGIIVSAPLIFALILVSPIRIWEFQVWVGLCSGYALLFVVFRTTKRKLIREFRVSHRFFVKPE